MKNCPFWHYTTVKYLKKKKLKHEHVYTVHLMMTPMFLKQLCLVDMYIVKSMCRPRK